MTLVVRVDVGARAPVETGPRVTGLDEVLTVRTTVALGALTGKAVHSVDTRTVVQARTVGGERISINLDYKFRQRHNYIE